MATRDVASLFALAVRTALASRLPSAFKVTKKDDSTAQVDAGTCVACCSSQSSFPAFVLDQLAKSVAGGSVQRLSSSFRELDGALKNLITTTPSSEGPRTGVLSGAFDVPQHGVSWTQALADSGQFGRGHGSIQLVTADFEAAKRVMSKLFDAKLEVIKLYLLVAPVAPFMALEHYAAQHRAPGDMSGAKSRCLDDLRFMFGGSFDKIAEHVLQMEKASVAFRSMWEDIRVSGAKSLQIAKGLKLDNAALMEAKFEKLGNAKADDQKVLSLDYGESFLANLILHQGHSKVRLNLTDLAGGAPNQDGGIHPSHFLPDYFYSGSTENAVNYGTLGVRAAAMMFRKSFPNSTKELPQFIKCFSKYASDTLQLSVDKAAWFRYAETHWSVDTALAALESDPYEHQFDALFYLRYARTYCGEPKSDVLVLKYALLASEGFASAFGCAKPKVMQC